MILLTETQLEIVDEILSLIKKNGNFISEFGFNSALKRDNEEKSNPNDSSKKYDEAELNFVTFFMSSELNLLKTWEDNDEFRFEYLALTKDGMEATEMGIEKFIADIEKLEKQEHEKLVIELFNSKEQKSVNHSNKAIAIAAVIFSIAVPIFIELIKLGLELLKLKGLGQ